MAGPAASCLCRHGSEQEAEDVDEMIRPTPAPIGRVMIEIFDFIEFCCGPGEADGSPPPL